MGWIVDQRWQGAGSPLHKNTLQVGTRPIDERWVAVAVTDSGREGPTPPQVTGGAHVAGMVRSAAADLGPWKPRQARNSSRNEQPSRNDDAYLEYVYLSVCVDYHGRPPVTTHSAVDTTRTRHQLTLLKCLFTYLVHTQYCVGILRSWPPSSGNGDEDENGPDFDSSISTRPPKAVT